MTTGAGHLDRQIELQSATQLLSADHNEPVKTWSTYAVVWAQARYLSEAESYSAEKWFAERLMVFRIRWRDDLDAEHRIRFDGAIYEIRGRPRPIGRNEFLDVPARLVE